MNESDEDVEVNIKNICYFDIIILSSYGLRTDTAHVSLFKFLGI